MDGWKANKLITQNYWTWNSLKNHHISDWSEVQNDLIKQNYSSNYGLKRPQENINWYDDLFYVDQYEVQNDLIKQNYPSNCGPEQPHENKLTWWNIIHCSMRSKMT